MSIYKNKTKLTVSIILNGELLIVLSLRLRMRQECPVVPFLCNIVLKILIKATIQEKFKYFWNTVSD